MSKGVKIVYSRLNKICKDNECEILNQIKKYHNNYYQKIEKK